MAQTTYTATLKVNCRKEHTCVGCGDVYSYALDRDVGASSTESAEAAQKMAKEKAAQIMQKAVDLHPCPTCGLYQPDMVAKLRKKRYLIILLVGTIASMITLLGASAGFASELSFTALQANTATIVMVVITTAVFVSYVLALKQANSPR